jgi:hypothetical protein
MRLWRWAALIAAASSTTFSAIHCGSRTGHDDGVGTDAAGESSIDAGVCGSPSGYVVCGGPNDCFPDGGAPCDFCTLQTIQQFGSPYTLGICTNQANPELSVAGLCDDDCVYVELITPGEWSTYPLEVGALFAANGAADRVRYADLSFYTGQPLPSISSCTSDAGFTACGGSCPPCSADRLCTGRSPLHPVGLCVPAHNCGVQGGWKCPQAADACFVFTVQPDAQALVDSDYGECLPLSECQAAAKSYPGGGTCHLQQ